ncbi:hypothetical protein C6499_14920 [Candidatus Poribacteria bacterium]|nr:MAG: hypothetical protein C6499_14920 [Candidatus Poribacteria bacterium]
MKHGAAKKRTHAHGARGNCTTCLQDPCGCVSQDIPASYGSVVYDDGQNADNHLYISEVRKPRQQQVCISAGEVS